MNKLYFIWDKVASAVVGPPFPMKNHAPAIREFYQLLGDKRTQLSTHPQDYDLIYVGEYDDDGIINGFLEVQTVATGADWLKAKQEQALSEAIG